MSRHFTHLHKNSLVGTEFDVKDGLVKPGNNGYILRGIC